MSENGKPLQPLDIFLEEYLILKNPKMINLVVREPDFHNPNSYMKQWQVLWEILVTGDDYGFVVLIYYFASKILKG